MYRLTSVKILKSGDLVVTKRFIVDRASDDFDLDIADLCAKGELRGMIDGKVYQCVGYTRERTGEREGFATTSMCRGVGIPSVTSDLWRVEDLGYRKLVSCTIQGKKSKRVILRFGGEL